MKKVMQVLVVDDHTVVREGLRTMLTSDPEIKVIGEAGTGEEAIDKTIQLKPDVVLTDIRMPGMSGIEITQRIKSVRPSTAVIILTVYDNETYLLEALRAGAVGYLAKDTPRELLCQAVKIVVEGGTTIRSSLLRQAIQRLLRTPRQPVEETANSGLKERFTVRELDVLRLVANGYTNREIAKTLNLAEVTVKKYVQTIIGKLGVSDRTNAAIFAVQMGVAE